MHPFEEYLKRHQLDALTVAVAARVRYTTIWNATRGNPIAPEHAQRMMPTRHKLVGIYVTFLR